MSKIKKLYETANGEAIEILPVTSTKAVYDHKNEKWLNESLDEVTQQLAQVKVNPLFLTTEDTESASLGVELVSDNGWTLGNGWAGSFTNGFTHTTGNIEPLVFSLGASAGKLYEVIFTVESTDVDHGFKLNVTIGDSFPFEIYRGAGNEIVYRNGIETEFDGDLKFIPKTNFEGTIKNISVREIIGFVNPSTAYFDKDEILNHEIRTTKTEQNNLFLGKGSGQRNTSGYSNVSFGHTSLVRNTSGYFNTAFGFNALLRNTVGSRNVALAYAALRDNISGHRNVAIGTFALNRNTHGHNNIAIGADTLWYNTTGNHNIALGLTSQEFNISGNGNVSLGYRSLLNNTTGNFNTVLGYDAARSVTASENAVFGAFGADALTTGDQNALFGSYVMRTVTTGRRNVAVGSFAGKGVNSDNNVFIGYNSADGLVYGANNIFIGANTTTANSTRVSYLNIGNALYSDLPNKILGIGVTDPTANLHIKANTAARPIMKFEVGVLTSTKHNGGWEYDGNELYFTKANGTRYKITMEAVS